MGAKRKYFTNEDQIKAARGWRKKYRDRINRELKEYRRIKRQLAKAQD